jgi:hypothetical protein
MRLYLVNMSQRSEFTAAVVQRIANAIEAQLYEDYAPMWQSVGAAVSIAPSLEGLPNDAAPIALRDAPDSSNAEGWHSYKNTGLVYGECFLDTVLDHGGTLIEGANSVSVLVSHECLETVEDPYANWLVQVDDKTIEWRELCDRVEGDFYDKEGVSVSNFLGPRAFRDGPGPYDKMELLTTPFEVRPGGYVDRWNVETGAVDTIWGDRMPAHTRQAKARSHRRERRFKTLDKLHARRRTALAGASPT